MNLFFIMSLGSEMYMGDIECGSCDGKAKPVVVKESPATAWVDGKNGLGPVVGNFCMEIAIKKVGFRVASLAKDPSHPRLFYHVGKMTYF